MGRCTATLIRVLGDIDLAEDAVAEAFATAAQQWRAVGIPPNPGGWITTTARRNAIDQIRRESQRPTRERAAMHLSDRGGEPAPLKPIPTIAELDASSTDDLLRLMFLCCHPALGVDAQVALTLRLVAGLTTEEIAAAFLSAEPTIGQRISRAKRKIRDANIPMVLPTTQAAAARTAAVRATIYLVYNEAHTATTGDRAQRVDLADTAIRLGRELVDATDHDPEAVGLLALMVLGHARSSARIDDAAEIVPLRDQDRSRWDQTLIDEGHELVRACLDRNQPGPLQIEAAIGAVHTSARRFEDTDWAQIVALYDHLLMFRDDDVVRLNRAIAVMEAHGAEPALAEIDELHLDDFHLVHAARAECLRRLGRIDEARHHLERARATTGNEPQRRLFVRAATDL